MSWLNYKECTFGYHRLFIFVDKRINNTIYNHYKMLSAKLINQVRAQQWIYIPRRPYKCISQRTSFVYGHKPTLRCKYNIIKQWLRSQRPRVRQGNSRFQYHLNLKFVCLMFCQSARKVWGAFEFASFWRTPHNKCARPSGFLIKSCAGAFGGALIV